MHQKARHHALQIDKREEKCTQCALHANRSDDLDASSPRGGIGPFMTCFFDFEKQLLSRLPPTFSGAVMEVHIKTGAPLEIVILSAISAISTSLHGVAIRAPDGRLMPTSLYCMGIAPTVSGKSAAMREFYKPIHEFDASLPSLRDAVSEEEGRALLRDLIQVDATWASLLEALNGKSHSLTIADDDCIDQLNGDLFKKRGKLNRFFDGPTKESLIRRDQDPLVAYTPSIGLCLMTQPEVFDEHQMSTRHMDRKSGLASRFIYAHTLSTKSFALPQTPTPHLDTIRAAMSAFLQHRISHRLAGHNDRLVVELTPGAAMRWTSIKAEVDQRVLHDLSHVRDSADRATEKTWRIAAALHGVSDADIIQHLLAREPSIPPIPAEMIEAAWAIVEWSMHQFAKVFPPPRPKPPKPSRVQERQREETRTAKRHLYDHLRRHGTETLVWSWAQSISWLSPYKFNNVIAHLTSEQKVGVIGGKDPVLHFLPAFFAEMSLESPMAPYTSLV